jgi:lysozyme
MMTTAQLSARLIQLAEGCKLRAYWDDTGKRWTIGFGHTLTAKSGMTITQAQADELFAQDCAPLLQMVADKPVIEAAALVDFGFNCGAEALRRLLAGEISLSSYGRTSGGVVLAGLSARRDLESALITASRDRV